VKRSFTLLATFAVARHSLDLPWRRKPLLSRTVCHFDRFGEQGFIAVMSCGPRILRNGAEFFDSILEKAWRVDEPLNKYADESLTQPKEIPCSGL
jgi:hypothetical protein